MKTYSEVIEETVEYYKTNPRALDEALTDCVYYTKTGAMCAIGRCAKDPQELEQIYGGGAIDYLINKIKDTSTKHKTNKSILQNEILKSEYRHLTDITFWADLQTYHDFNVFWKDGKLNESGEHYLNSIREKYKGK
jgi:hypothetical protein